MFSSIGFRAGATAVVLLGFSMSGAYAESLKAALTSAYANNPSITSALISVKVAAENIALRKSATRPTIGASTGLSDTFGYTSGANSHTLSATAGLGYSQTIFDNHKTDAEVEQARALVQVANQNLRTTEANVLLSAVQAYMNVILNTQLVTLRSDAVTFYQSQVKASQDRQNIGEGTKIDVAQAQAALASAVAAQKAAIASLQTANASYVHWVGHKPSNLSSDFSYGSLIPPTVEKAVSLADAYNPTILAAKAGIRAAKAGVDAADAAFGPSVALAGSLGPSLSTTCINGNCTGSTPGVGGKLSLSFTLPVIAGGALGAGDRQANLSQAKSQFDAESARQQAREQVITAWSALQNASAQIDAANSGVSAGQLALNGVVQERDVGQKTTLDVLNAESVLTTANEAAVSAAANRVIAAFSLISATGRMSPRDLGLRASPKSADQYTQKVEDTWTEARSLK